MTLEDHINEVYEIGLKNLCQELSDYNDHIYFTEKKSSSPMIKTQFDITSLSDFEKNLMMDNINHILVELLYDNTKRPKSQKDTIVEVCQKYNLSVETPDSYETLSKYMYSIKHSTKIFTTNIYTNTLKNWLNKYNINIKLGINKNDLIFPEAYVWSRIYKSELSELGIIDDERIRNISNIIFNYQKGVCGLFFNNSYINNSNKANVVMLYYHMEKTCRFSLIMALEKFIEKCAVNLITGESNQRLTYFTKVSNSQMASHLITLIPLCLEYPFNYEAIISEMESDLIPSEFNNLEYQDNNSQFITINDVSKTITFIKNLYNNEFDKLSTDIISNRVFIKNNIKKQFSEYQTIYKINKSISAENISEICLELIDSLIQQNVKVDENYFDNITEYFTNNFYSIYRNKLVAKNLIPKKEIVNIYIKIKKKLRNQFDELYYKGEINLDAIKKYISNNYTYYFPKEITPKIRADKCKTFSPHIDKSYIINITYLIYVLYGTFPSTYNITGKISVENDCDINKVDYKNTEEPKQFSNLFMKNSNPSYKIPTTYSDMNEINNIFQNIKYSDIENIWNHLLDIFIKDFPFNKMYQQFIEQSSYSDDQLKILAAAYNIILSDNLENGLNIIGKDSDEIFQKKLDFIIKKLCCTYTAQSQNESSSVPRSDEK